MPIYEYRCNTCGRRSSHFFRSFAAVTAPACPHCGGTDLRKLVSLVAVLKSEESRLEELADPSLFGDVDENDPRSVAQFARKLGEQMGSDLPDDYKEMVDQLEAGELPDEAAGGAEGDTGDAAADDL